MGKILTSQSVVKFASIIGLCVCLSNCSKSEHLQIDNESQTCVDFAFAEQEFCNFPAIIFPHLMHALGTKGLKSGALSGNPFSLVSGDTIDFDPMPTYSLSAEWISSTMNDGKARTGIIWLSLSKPLTTTSAMCFLKLENYVAGGIQYVCKGMTITTVGESANYFAQDLSVRGGECSIGQQTFLYEGDHRCSIFYSGGPLGPSAYYSAYGSAHGQSRTGLSYTATVMKDLVKFNNCYCISAGQVDLQPAGFQGKALDFGVGECDDLAHFTIDENKVAFKLK